MAISQIKQNSTDVSMLPLGVGQTWQDVTASRALGTTYTNNTGRPIIAEAWCAASAANAWFYISINGAAAKPAGSAGGAGGAGYAIGGSRVIPAGATYAWTLSSGGVSSGLTFQELR